MFNKSIIPNYIPHKKKKHVYFNEWYSEYKNHIINLYQIVNDVVDSKFKYRNDINYKEFCILLYKNSSRHIIKT